MIRTIMTPNAINIQLTIPKEYIGKPIEITYLSLDEIEQKPDKKKTMSDFFGILDDKTYKKLKKQTEQARKEWNRNF